MRNVSGLSVASSLKLQGHQVKDAPAKLYSLSLQTGEVLHVMAKQDFSWRRVQRKPYEAMVRKKKGLSTIRLHRQTE
jgi:hypothetical protein